MSVKFFKRLSLFFCGFFTFAVAILALGMGSLEQPAVKIVYFVIEPTDSVQASSGQIALRGGAGYPIGGGVAFGVYFTKTEAKEVLGALQVEYVNACIYPMEVRICDAEDDFAYTAMQVVDGWTEYLRDGGNQKTAQSGLTEVVGLLNWKGEQVGSTFLLRLSEALQDSVSGTVLRIEKLREFTCFALEELSLKNRRQYFKTERI
jgi:hypothetical protein